MKSVTIPSDYFFNMATKDYYNWKSGLIREFIQNSVDAGSDQVEFCFDEKWLEIKDNGCGMTLDTIESALLTLGGSHKTDSSIGGFGKAKELLYFAWPQWEIHSNEHLIIGKGPQYRSKKETLHKGTISRIYVHNKLDSIDYFIKQYLNLCSFNGDEISISFNGKRFDIDGVKYGEKVYTIDGLGDLYRTDFSGIDRVIVQAHGLYMFSSHSVLDKSYVFNITQPSYDCLTSNRDSFVGEWQDKFTRMIGKVAIDSESTNLKKETVIQVSALRSANTVQDLKEKIGDESYQKLVALAQANQKDISLLTHKDIAELLNSEFLTTESIVGPDLQQIKAALVPATAINRTKLFDQCLEWYKKVFPQGFIIVTDQTIDSDLVMRMYQVDTLKMTWIWKVVVDEIADLSGIEKSYGYGLLMSRDTSLLAQCRDNYILYNPTPFMEMDWHECIVEFVLSAAEELTHFIGHPYHNESFKCSLMRVVKAVVMERLTTADIYRKSNKVTRKHGVKD